MTALAFVAAMVTVIADDPAHFPDPYDVGAYAGLTPRLFQSGEVAENGRISKGGDGLARHRLYEAAHSLLVRVKDGPAPKVWAARLARHVGPKKPRVARVPKLGPASWPPSGTASG